MIEFDILSSRPAPLFAYAIFGTRAGTRVLLLEKDADIGGTSISSGHISPRGPASEGWHRDSIDDH
jgi:hypothetical protein